jgi:hypothetical protein
MDEAARRAVEIGGFIDVMVLATGISQRSFAADTNYSVDDLLMDKLPRTGRPDKGSSLDA